MLELRRKFVIQCRTQGSKVPTPIGHLNITGT